MQPGLNEQQPGSATVKFGSGGDEAAMPSHFEGNANDPSELFQPGANERNLA